ncbi:hypothetical protein C0Q70_19959 [Pomacea canaliculata]|uniref:Ig-like domain-containing protein n=1 Tax=Pomacea canaliculata TaxID=400727 RepID=A0A2T7NE67_POMCA|nr:hypothetical protein C0Q70_19959 [Pomacea canaliculata]
MGLYTGYPTRCSPIHPPLLDTCTRTRANLGIDISTFVFVPDVTNRREPKKPNIQITGAKFVDEGEKIFLICNATAQDQPPDDLDWFRDGEKLQTSESKGVYIRKSYTLVDWHHLQHPGDQERSPEGRRLLRVSHVQPGRHQLPGQRPQR